MKTQHNGTTTSNNAMQRRSAIFDTETAVVSMQNGNDFEAPRGRTSLKKRSSKKCTTGNQTGLESLMLTFLSGVILWMMIFCFKATIHNDTADQRMQKSKSSFAVKRKPLMSYLDERLPPAAGDSHQFLGEEGQIDTDHRVSTANVGDLPVNLNPVGNLQDNRPSRRALVTGKEAATETLDHPQPQQRPPTNQAKTKVAHKGHPNQKILMAYLEPPSTLSEQVKPLPPRTTSKSQLRSYEFSEVSQCSTLLRDFGKHVVDQYPFAKFPLGDPYLPWLHDFYVSNGTMHFIGQNRRNCLTGEGMYTTMKYWKPQIALFQPVPVIQSDNNGSGEPRFRLADSLENATAKETRFLCRFHDARNKSGITLSAFPFNYEFVSWRKNQNMLEEQTSKNPLKQSPFWVSQLLFSCPIPEQFQAIMRRQRHVVDDQARLWVDVIPIRTPARSDKPLLTKEMVGEKAWTKNFNSFFQLDIEYGKNHTLPAISDSGRWANLPVCLPPNPTEQTIPSKQVSNGQPDPGISQTTDEVRSAPKHRLVACTWTSASNERRGNAVTVRDSQVRLREWVLFHQMVGVDHLYIYDNSATEEDLESVAREFPEELVTYLSWPCKVCSNNRPMNKNPGDRSSQYAAEASCRERFGPSTKWMSFIDTDEYLVPMKNETWTGLLDEMESKNIQVLKMRSSRGLPRHDLMQSLPDQGACEMPVKRSAAVRKLDQSSCQEPNPNETFLKVYNCDYIKPPRPDRFARAMKQIYRPQYVKSHYVHYSTVTDDVARYQKDQPNADGELSDYKATGADKELFLDELTQGTLIHARSVLPHETIYRVDMCRLNSKHKCPLGYVCPNSTVWVDDKLRPNQLNPFVDERGNYCNCWINEQVENVMVPQLERALKKHLKAMQ